jgi:hypothetical protein
MVTGATKTCAACGMRLALPGLVRDGRAFCCHGCAKGEQLLPPAKTRTVSAARAVHIDRTPEEVGRFLADITFSICTSRSWLAST